jgi:hypothetical protein
MGVSGLVGTLEVAIIDNDNNVVFGPTSLGIIENFVGGSPTGYYTAELVAPAALGQYSIVWSPDGTFSDETNVTDELTVLPVGAGAALPPISPIGPGPGPVPGPCNAWATEEEVAACCSVEVGTDFDLFTEVATSASRLLFELEGRLHAGTCEKTVRPCQTGGCGTQILSRGHIVTWDGNYWRNGGAPTCGCRATSTVWLSGYPVREVIEVKIDGVLVAPSEYRLDEWRKLTRLNGERWPLCQRLDLNDSEEGTWSVRYTYGQNPPDIGRSAAAQLACEIYKACQGLECKLPTGVTRITRQNVTIERTYFQRDADGVWRTGLQLVDLFLNSVNRAGILRRPSIYAPGHRYARPVGGA